jgi:hypothetical protein
MDFNGLRLFAFVDDAIEQHGKRRFAQRIFRLMDSVSAGVK